MTGETPNKILPYYQYHSIKITTTKERDMDEFELELLNMSREEMDRIANGEDES